MTDFIPRPSQQAILRYTGGRLGIAAVPGAGKTHILSALAAKIIREGWLGDDQEVLIVTLVNSAVDNFEARIKKFFDNPLQALYKYRVRTLHGLAHDIVREKPARVGLEERFSIIDERESGFIRRESVNAWLANHSLEDYLDPALEASKRDWAKRDQLPDLLDSLALAFIRSAKDRLLTPEDLRAKLDASPAPLPLAELGWSIYADYQRALAYRGAVDFDDLIRLALILLETDEEYLARLQYRYPFILEDEAQDSSLTQERILSLLSGSASPSPFGRGAGGEGLPSPFGRGAGGEGLPLPPGEGRGEGLPLPLGEGRGEGLPSPFGRGAGGEGLSSPPGRGAGDEGLPSPFGRGAGGEDLPLPLGEGPGVRASPLPLGEGRGEGLPSPFGRGAGGEGGNWVRVGDPNQAIFETFTTASPDLLRAFIQNNPHQDMPESGRSQPSIIAVANHLIDWVMTSHPIPAARDALQPPHIVPVPQDDPQQNPPNDPEAIKFIPTRFTPEQELEAVAKSVKSYLDSFTETPIEEQPTVAILVPRNQRGVEVVNALRRRGIEPIELISSTSETRAAAGSLSYLLSYLADPISARKLAKAYEVWRRGWREDSEKMALVSDVERVLRKIEKVEEYVSPHLDLSPGEKGKEPPSPAGEEVEVRASPLLLGEGLGGRAEPPQVIQELSAFRVVVQRWLNAVTLPIDQLILTLAQDVFSEASDLALAHKLALMLRQAVDDHPDWRLPELTSELAVIAKNERRFIGFSSDDSGFDPEKHRGRVVVTTMHKAKGLEWDRVYLMSVNNYDFPSNLPGDRFISEKWFIRGGLNLEAEALAQLSILESTSEYDRYEEGAATLHSRLDYVKERLRLFYVGITRAKRELIVTWNTGRQGDATPSIPLSELMGWWEAKGERRSASSSA